MKRLCLSTLAAATLAMAATARDYIPLLEDGKEWHYTSVCWYTDKPDGGFGPGEHLEMLRLEGRTLIDGEEYHILNLYYGADPNDLEFICPVAYLKEDAEARRVWVKINEESFIQTVNELADIIRQVGSDLMYDFNYTDNTYIVDFKYTYGDATDLMCEDGIHHGVTIMINGADSPYSLIEGIGLVGDGIDGSCYLLYYGESFVSSYYRYQWPFLYKVTSGNGDIIYYNENVAPGFAGVITEKADSDTSVRVFNLQGIPVKEADGIAGSTDGLAPGVYLIQTGATTRKILVGNR